jgi:hypothetical protein
MHERRAKAREYHEAIRSILLREWDPIGVNEVPEAQDEYDAYVSQIHGLLIRREPLHTMVDYLWWAETEHMGLCGNRSRTEAVAQRLMHLPEELSGSA